MTERPNVVVIVLDDVGFSDLGPYGSEIRTPAIDQLAREGVRFNRFDTKAICSPTRAALLTGCNPQTVQMADLPGLAPNPSDTRKDRGELPENARTLAQVLHDAGYATMALGKWHLAPGNENGQPGHNKSWPLQRGFDRFYGFISGWTDQYHPDLVDGNTALPRPNVPGYHLSVDLVDHAIRDIDDVTAATPDKPFFTYLAFGAAHSPLQVPRAYIDRYAGVYEKGWDVLRAERFARMQSMGLIPSGTKLPAPNTGDRSWSSLSEDEQIVFARFMATYAGYIEHTDEQIGRLIRHLKDTRLYDNTLLIVLSDNGAAPEAGQTGSFEHLYVPNTLTPRQMRNRLDELGTDKTQSQYQRPWAMLGDTPFRRYKLWPHAGGVRTPLIISWPGHVTNPGSVRQQYLDVIDLAPTIAELAGTTFPTTVNGTAQVPVAGRSIRAALRDPNAPGRDVQFFDLRGNRGITSGTWKALAIHQVGQDFSTDRWELFDLANDYAESTNVAARYPQKLEELKALWANEAARFSNPPLMEFSAFNAYDDELLDPTD
ncbi:sulfatase [Burkholderia cepacia]|uniref:arylsulfatase n=1 Tax=Burkholderia cepacia TaxID=292 RepID=UPI00076BDACA|nr:arylsulfatase [Burkholderia cepacia]KWE18320.1 sulfatase [Burkholderia cepacia]